MSFTIDQAKELVASYLPVLFYDFVFPPNDPPAWAASTAYPINLQVFDGLNVQIVTTGGSSGATAPTWNATVGATTTDGTVIWTNQGPPVSALLHLARLDVTWPGNPTYGSTAYLGRIENDDIDTVAMLDASGVDIPPRLSLSLADSDSYLLAYYEQYPGRGFRGCIVTVTLVFYDVLGQQFSTDYAVRYVGICDSAALVDDSHLSVRTTYKALLQQKQLPSALIQQYCWKIQPQTQAQFAQALIDHNQFWWCGLTAADYTGPCGYTRLGCIANNHLPYFSGVDFQVTNSYGGLGENFVSGAKVQLYNIGATLKYGDPFPIVFGAGWVNCPILNMRQDGNYTRMDVSLCIDQIDTGLAATKAMQVICNGEAILPGSYDIIDPVTHEITGTGTLSTGQNPAVAWWNWIGRGTRSATPPNATVARAGMSGLITPYGSDVVIEVVVPNSIASGGSLPTVTVLYAGPALRVYTDPVTYTEQWPSQMSVANLSGSFTCNPAWLLMYILTLSGWDYTDLDIPAFIQAALDCAETITYTSQYSGYGLTESVSSIAVTNKGGGYDSSAGPGEDVPPTVVISGGGGSGATAIALVTPIDHQGGGGHVYQIQVTNPGSGYTSVPTVTLVAVGGHGSGATAVATLDSSAKHQRYMCNLIVPFRRSSGDILQGVRRTMLALLQPNSAGLISVQVKGPLAVEQPGLPDGSNYTLPVASVLRDGTPAVGYVAYSFDEDTAFSIKGIERPITDTANCLQFTFQDSENVYAATSVSIVDSVDSARIGQQINKSIVFDGCPTNDQANRLALITNKETLYGNPSGDSRGTMWLQIKTSIRALKIGMGNLIWVSWVKLNLVNQLFRVMSVAGPAHDGTVTLTAAWHNDNWYVDNANQSPDPPYSNPQRNQLIRPSNPLCPNTVFPRAGDPYYAPSDGTFALAPEWTLGPDGKWNGTVNITTAVGVNNPGLAQPPQPALQGFLSPTGGSIGPGLYYVAICSKDSAGNYSFPSLVGTFYIPSGTTNSISIPVLWWDKPATAGYAIFAGMYPSRLSWQGDGTNDADAVGIAPTVTLTRYNVLSWGAPDQELDAIISQAQFILHSGIAGVQVHAVSTGEINISTPGTPWTADILAGYACTVLAKADGSALPVLSYAITGNTTSGVLSVTPDPMLDGLAPDDVIAIRSKPVWTDGGQTATDAQWINPFGTGGMNPAQEVGNWGLIVAGTGLGLTNPISAATPTSHTFGQAWAVTPDATTVYIVVKPNWQPLASPVRGINNASPATSLALSFPITNLSLSTILVALQSEDGGENPGAVAMMPFREIYVFGQPEQVLSVTANYTVSPSDQSILVDTTTGPVTIQLLAAAAMISPSLMIKKISVDTNAVTVLAATGEMIEGSNSYLLPLQYSFFRIARINS
jgi:hypothetical protein